MSHEAWIEGFYVYCCCHPLLLLVRGGTGSGAAALNRVYSVLTLAVFYMSQVLSRVGLFSRVC